MNFLIVLLITYIFIPIQFINTKSFYPIDGLVIYLPLNGSAQDYSGNENHGFVEGPILTPNRYGEINNAYEFSGSGSTRIRIPTSTSIPYGSKSRSISLWIYTTSGSWRNSPYHAPFFYGSKTTGTKKTGFGMCMKNYPGIFFFFWGDDLHFDVSLNGGRPEGWIHISVTSDYNDDDGTTKAIIYVNGIFSNEKITTNVIDTTISDVYIGNCMVDIRPYKGKIDEFFLYNRTLSNDEIMQIYLHSEKTNDTGYITCRNFEDNRRGCTKQDFNFRSSHTNVKPDIKSNGDHILISDETVGSGGYAFSTTYYHKINLCKEEFQFKFTYESNFGQDGWCFLFHTISPFYLGIKLDKLGTNFYLQNAISVEFDYYKNPGGSESPDPTDCSHTGGSHVGINVGGTFETKEYSCFVLEGMRNVSVSYNKKKEFTVNLMDYNDPNINTTVILRNVLMETILGECEGYFSWVSGTGGNPINVKIHNFEMIGLKSCFGINFNDSSVCNGNGSCVSFDKCLCNPGFAGVECSEIGCFGIVQDDEEHVCNGHGKCEIGNICVCNATDYFEEDCRLWKCFEKLNNESNVCSGFGQCIDHNSCSCDVAHFTDDCHKFTCFDKAKNDTNVCSGHGNCTAGNQCVCDHNYSGIECQNWDCTYFTNNNHILVDRSDTRVCNENGVCSSYQNCTCKHLYYGKSCEKWNCFGVEKSNTSVCTGFGLCILPNNCSCSENYIGVSCEEWACGGISNKISSICSNRGNCTSPNVCMCNEPSKYGGTNCEKDICYGALNDSLAACNNRGDCISPNNCSCDDFNSGDECQYCDINYYCSGNADYCINNQLTNCSCKSGYYGLNCSLFDCYPVFFENFYDNFNTFDSSKWVYSSGVNHDNTCGSFSGLAIQFNGAGERKLKTKVFKVDTSVEVTFTFWAAFGYGCESPDSGEGLDINVIVDGSSTYAKYIPHNNGNGFITPIIFSVSKNFQIQIIQRPHSIPNGDAIAIDEVSITFGTQEIHTGNCNHPNGNCTSPDTCVCKEIYYGLECENWDCFKIPKNESNVCSGFGQCIDHNSCSCDVAHFTDDCHKFTCFDKAKNDTNVCSGHGNCTAGNQCVCDHNYSGIECQNWDCTYFTNNNHILVDRSDTRVCNENGVCASYQNCSCKSGFYGESCEKWNCFGIEKSNTSVCTGFGLCILPNNCSCSENHFEKDCRNWTCFSKNKNDENVCNGNGLCTRGDTCENCNYHYYGKECFNWECIKGGKEKDDKQIIFVNTAGKKNWQDAEDYCIENYNHGHLVSIHSDEENNVVKSLTGSEVVWIGFNDHAIEGNWVWTSDEPVVYTRWNNNEPNNAGGEDCATMLTTGSWNDDLFSKTYYFVCEFYSNDVVNCSSHGECVSAGNCSCDEGYYNNYCELWDCFEYQYNSSDVCSRLGQCNSPNNCSCDVAHFGDDCHKFTCFDKAKNDTNVCSGHGNCTAGNQCVCENNYSGNECQNWDCTYFTNNNHILVDRSDTRVCNENGVCTSYQNCSCKSGFYGESCEKWNCFGIEKSNTSVCTGFGLCILPNNCSCSENHFEKDCRNWTCFSKNKNDENVCNGNGLCTRGDTCENCNYHYYGKDCFNWECIKGGKEKDDKQIIFVNTAGKKNWQDAEDYCIENYNHGHLVSIHSEEENNVVKSLTGSEVVWIGFNDHAIEGNWVWTSDDPVVYTLWSYNEPNNAGGEDCATMLTTGSWNDDLFSKTYYFVCEFYSNDVVNCSSHGECVSAGNCSCDEGYYNNYCELWDCFEYQYNSSDVCSRFGQCNTPNNCSCNDYHYLANCSEWDCYGKNKIDPEVCGKGRGVCISGNNCSCYLEGYLDEECSNWQCGLIHDVSPFEKIFTTSKSWYDAETYCNSIHGTLLKLQSQDSGDLGYYNRIKNQITSSTWIGFSDVKQNKCTFRWTDGSSGQIAPWKKEQQCQNVWVPDCISMMGYTFCYPFPQFGKWKWTCYMVTVAPYCSNENNCVILQTNGEITDTDCTNNYHFYCMTTEKQVYLGNNFNDSNVCSSLGNCVAPDNCTCEKGYYGEICQHYKCFGTHFQNSLVCSGVGNCVSPDNCDNWECNHVQHNKTWTCTGHGQCISPNECICKENYNGSYCHIWYCYDVLFTSGSVCSGYGYCIANDTCSDWKCFGVAKDNPDVCSSHGECLTPDNCLCKDTRYTNEDCSIWQCFESYNNESDVCSGFGNCVDYNNCSCNDYHLNYNCSDWNCYGKNKDDPDVCFYKNGTCESGNNCVCKKGYYDLECNKYNCNGIPYDYSIILPCGSHGKCIYPDECLCFENYFGKKCDKWFCFDKLNNDTSVCSGFGKCVEYNKCACNSFHFEKDCSDWNCYGVNKNDSKTCSAHGVCSSGNNCTCEKDYFSSAGVSENIWNCDEWFCKEKNHNYLPPIYVSTRMTWKEAQTHCESLGANLPSIHNASEAKLWCNNIPTNIIYETETWIGLYAKKYELVLKWTDGTQIDYSNWWYYPNFYNYYSDYFGTLECCSGGYYCYRPQYSWYMWDDMMYSNSKRNFYCSYSEFFFWSNYDNDTCNGNGECVASGQCKCKKGYYGENCIDWGCHQKYKSDPNVCSSHGECIDYDVCECYDKEKYWGEKCNNFTCFYKNKMNKKACSGHGIYKFNNIYFLGECVDFDVCECYDDYYGQLCEFKYRNSGVAAAAGITVALLSICCVVIVVVGVIFAVLFILKKRKKVIGFKPEVDVEMKDLGRNSSVSISGLELEEKEPMNILKDIPIEKRNPGSPVKLSTVKRITRKNIQVPKWISDSFKWKSSMTPNEKKIYKRKNKERLDKWNRLHSPPPDEYDKDNNDSFKVQPKEPSSSYKKDESPEKEDD